MFIPCPNHVVLSSSFEKDNSLSKEVVSGIPDISVPEQYVFSGKVSNNNISSSTFKTVTLVFDELNNTWLPGLYPMVLLT